MNVVQLESVLRTGTFLWYVTEKQHAHSFCSATKLQFISVDKRNLIKTDGGLQKVQC